MRGKPRAGSNPRPHAYEARALPTELRRRPASTGRGRAVSKTQQRKGEPAAMGTWCSGINPASRAGGPWFNPQRVHCPGSIAAPSEGDLVDHTALLGAMARAAGLPRTRRASPPQPRGTREAPTSQRLELPWKAPRCKQRVARPRSRHASLQARQKSGQPPTRAALRSSHARLADGHKSPCVEGVARAQSLREQEKTKGARHAGNPKSDTTSARLQFAGRQKSTRRARRVRIELATLG